MITSSPAVKKESSRITDPRLSGRAPTAQMFGSVSGPVLGGGPSPVIGGGLAPVIGGGLRGLLSDPGDRSGQMFSDPPETPSRRQRAAAQVAVSSTDEFMGVIRDLLDQFEDRILQYLRARDNAGR